ncbi:hypothetical protein U1Q18_020433, partial [Sarracenia purpurea var. burkii]
MPSFPTQGNWFSVLDRNARYECYSDEDEVEAITRNLEQTCGELVGRFSREDGEQIHE